MSGEIHVTSTENVETTFNFTVRVKPIGHNTFEIVSEESSELPQ